MAEHGALFSKTRRQLQGRRGITSLPNGTSAWGSL